MGVGFILFHFTGYFEGPDWTHGNDDSGSVWNEVLELIWLTSMTAAHASSPATAEALISELNDSQPELLRRITVHVPRMLPKAYRWVGEMEEVAEFVGGGEEEIYRGLAKVYARVSNSINGDGKDIEVLERFVGAAEKTLKGA